MELKHVLMLSKSN